MPKVVSQALRDRVMRTSAPEYPIVLLELTHPQLIDVVRIANDTQDLVSNGNTYTAVPFRVLWPDDQDQQLPRARLAIDNVGKELVEWLEVSGGGQGASVTLMQVLRSQPDTVELSVTLDLLSVSMSVTEVTAELGFENIFLKPFTRVQYRPDSHPAVF